MTISNFKFAITSKSGHSVVMEFKNHDAAQKYADRHFGKGCIVQLVGNSAVRSTNPVVQNALMANASPRAVIHRPMDATAKKMVRVDMDNFTFEGKEAKSMECTLANLRGFLAKIGIRSVEEYRRIGRELNNTGLSSLTLTPKLRVEMLAKYPIAANCRRLRFTIC